MAAGISGGEGIDFVLLQASVSFSHRFQSQINFELELVFDSHHFTRSRKNFLSSPSPPPEVNVNTKRASIRQIEPDQKSQNSTCGNSKS